MSDNEMQSIDLVVGPLENFDDAVAFGDALYGLEGVTRLALNEFEGQRASFTFSARSLESVAASLAGMTEFPISAIDNAVDGTMQVRLGGGLKQPEAAFAEAPLEDPQSYVQEEAPSGDPFVSAPTFAEPSAVAPIEEPWAPTEDFGKHEATTMAPPPVEPYQQPAAWPDESPVSPDPTPLFPALDAAMDQGRSMTQDDDPNGEVARVIEKLAMELRETAEHLTALAAGLTPAAVHEPEPEAEPVSDWQSAEVEHPDTGWAEDPPAASEGAPEYDVSTTTDPAQPAAAPVEDSWQASPQAPAAASVELAAEDEQGAWEAPRMPAVGAMAPIGGEGAPNEFMTEAHSAQAIALATASGRRPSQVQLMASGFASFGIANSFIAAVRQIPGVRNVAIVELDQGRLKLTLDYFGSESLEGQLNQLRDFPHQVVRASGKEIEIQLMAA